MDTAVNPTMPPKSKPTSPKPKPRSTKPKPAPAAVPTPITTEGLAVSDLRLRLLFLEKDNEKVLKKIQKAQRDLDNFNTRAREIATEMFQRMAPILQETMEIQDKIHETFQQILTERKMGKTTRYDVEQIYANLQMMGIISPREDEEEEDEDVREIFGDFTEEESEFENGFGGNRFTEMLPDDGHRLDRDEQKKIRQLFLKLADVFHPDKVPAGADVAYHTQVMQEINEAYQSGDLAKLLEIEKRHQMGESIDLNSEGDLQRSCARLERENELLKSQLAKVRKELKEVKKSPPGELVVTEQKLQKHGIDAVEESVSEHEEDLELIRGVYEFVVKFRDREITVKEFVRGPDILMERQEEMREKMMMEFMSEHFF
jgi:predicted HTH domain antitoxin